jgi:sugar-specific transcriptional regulator TrmB
VIVKEEFLNKLRRYFSLNLYEAKVWAALLSRGVSTAGELSDIANVPRSRSYDILETLEKKGFVVMKLGKPIKYLAVPPTEVVSRVKKNMKEEADEKVKRLDSLNDSDLMKELSSLHNQGIELVEPTDYAGSLKGRRNLYDHLEQTLKSAEKNVNIVTTAQGFLRKAEGMKHIFQQLKDKGVTIRIAAPISSKQEKDMASDLKGLVEVKNSKGLNARFCTVDGKHVTFMVLDDKDVHPNYDVGIWSHGAYFAGALDHLFNHAWKDME